MDISIYKNSAQLDHDIEAMLNEMISTLVSRGVDRDDAIDSIQRMTEQVA